VQQLRFRILSQSLHPFAFELSASLCIRALLLCAAVVAMASLVHPEHFQSEGALNLMRHLLGCRDGNFTRGFGYPSDIRPVGSGFGHEI
jgi:hypothetical protein